MNIQITFSDNDCYDKTIEETGIKVISNYISSQNDITFISAVCSGYVSQSSDWEISLEVKTNIKFVDNISREVIFTWEYGGCSCVSFDEFDEKPDICSHNCIYHNNEWYLINNDEDYTFIRGQYVMHKYKET